MDLAPLIVVQGDRVSSEPAPHLGVATAVEPFEIPAGQATVWIVCHQFSSWLCRAGYVVRPATSWTAPSGM